MTEEKKIVPKRTVNYDVRRKELTITTEIEELQLPSGEISKDFGSNKNVQIIKEKGMRALMTDMNEQKVYYQREHKHVCEQIKKVPKITAEERVELDKLREQINKLKSFDNLTKLEDNKLNAEEAVSSINKQINDIKGAVGTNLKW